MLNTATNSMDDYNFITRLPGLLMAKDEHSTFLSVSQDLTKLLGWKSSHECHGKTDYDIPCHAASFADEFIKMDKEVIRSGTKLLTLEIQSYSSGVKLLLLERNPVKSADQKVVGIFDQCIDVTDSHQFRAHYLLYLLDGKFIGKSFKPAIYRLSHFHAQLNLTEKQECCLFLLIRGKTAKEIAELLTISPRTVEDRIEVIKTKLNCQSRSEVIEKAIERGFLYYIPKCLQGQELKKFVGRP